MYKLLFPHFLCLTMFVFCVSAMEAQEKLEASNSRNNNAQESAGNFYTSQFKAQDAIDGFGYYKLYNNAFNFETNKLSITLGAGLLEQNTIFNKVAPTFSGSFNSYFEYKLNNRFSAYLFGQYLTPSFNNESNLQDIFMHPLFPQTEIGAGLKGNFNNVKIDVGTRTIFNSQLSPKGPTQFLNSKVSIGF